MAGIVERGCRIKWASNAVGQAKIYFRGNALPKRIIL
jgi:hypothetical protein